MLGFQVKYILHLVLKRNVHIMNTNIGITIQIFPQLVFSIIARAQIKTH